MQTSTHEEGTPTQRYAEAVEAIVRLLTAEQWYRMRTTDGPRIARRIVAEQTPQTGETE